MSLRSRDVNRPPTPEPESRELNLEEKIRYQLYASGERDRLKALLQAKLEASGWRDEVKERCREFVAKQGGNASIDDIVRAVRPAGRSLVPDSLKAELLAELKKFILAL